MLTRRTAITITLEKTLLAGGILFTESIAATGMTGGLAASDADSTPRRARPSLGRFGNCSFRLSSGLARCV